jgi:hypothetical protein
MTVNLSHPTGDQRVLHTDHHDVHATRVHSPFNHTRTCNKLRPVYRYTGEVR